MCNGRLEEKIKTHSLNGFTNNTKNYIIKKY